MIVYSDSKRERNRNSVARIKEERFFVVTKPEISQGNKGIVLQQLKDASRKENLPKIEEFAKSEYITPNVPLVSLTNVPDISLLNVPLFTGCN